MSASVYWLTGLSGAGKTTVARELAGRLRAAGRPVLELDGDRLREIVGREHDHATSARLDLAMRYARLCREVALQGLDVVCATVSMFHDVHRWNRKHIPGYVEIFLKVPLDELKRRDPKGLYRAYDRGELTNLVGLDVPPEYPTDPDLVIENHTGMSVQDTVATIWAACVRNG